MLANCDRRVYFDRITSTMIERRRRGGENYNNFNVGDNKEEDPASSTWGLFIIVGWGKVAHKECAGVVPAGLCLTFSNVGIYSGIDVEGFCGCTITGSVGAQRVDRLKDNDCLLLMLTAIYTGTNRAKIRIDCLGIWVRPVEKTYICP